MLDNYKTMDINILLSIVNMKLRNEKQPLAGFCSRYQMQQSTLLQRFEQHGFTYHVQQNQFKQNSMI